MAQPIVYAPNDLTGEPTVFVQQLLFAVGPNGRRTAVQAKPRFGLQNYAMRLPRGVLKAWTGELAWPDYMSRAGYVAELRVWAEPKRWVVWRRTQSSDAAAERAEKEAELARVLEQVEKEQH